VDGSNCAEVIDMNPWVIIGWMLFWLASILGAEQYGDHARGIKDDLQAAKLQLAEDKKINDARNENDALNQELEKQHANAETALNILLSIPAPIVRIPTCGNSGTSAAAVGSKLLDAGGQRAADTFQSAFDDFIKGSRTDASEWSTALNACKPVMTWAKSQVK
jgi:hypothetical protein